MIQFITFDDELKLDSYLAIEERLNNFLNLSEINSDMELKIILNFSTPGGYVYIGNYFAALLNDCLKYFTIEIRTGAQVMSSGISVLKKFKGKVTIDPGTIGMIHKESALLESKYLSNISSCEIVNKRNMDKQNISFLREIKHLLTDEQINDYNKGETVFIDYKMIKKIIDLK